MIKISIFLFLSMLFPAYALAGPAAKIPGLEIDDAWIAEAPPVSSVNAAYMKIVNASAADIRIVSISCDNYSSAEFHRTVHVDGVASMRHLDELVVHAGSTLALEPGDYHVMLFNPVRALHSGEESRCTLKLDDGRSLAVTLAVMKSSDAASHHHH